MKGVSTGHNATGILTAVLGGCPNCELQMTLNWAGSTLQAGSFGQVVLEPSALEGLLLGGGLLGLVEMARRKLQLGT